MIPENDVEFCRRREAEERDAAATATDMGVRDVHRGWADRYADRIWSIEEGYTRPNAAQLEP